jgi:hypothetical protein
MPHNILISAPHEPLLAVFFQQDTLLKAWAMGVIDCLVELVGSRRGL